MATLPPPPVSQSARPFRWAYAGNPRLSALLVPATSGFGHASLPPLLRHIPFATSRKFGSDRSIKVEDGAFAPPLARLEPRRARGASHRPHGCILPGGGRGAADGSAETPRCPRAKRAGQARRRRRKPGRGGEGERPVRSGADSAAARHHPPQYRPRRIGPLLLARRPACFRCATRRTRPSPTSFMSPIGGSRPTPGARSPSSSMAGPGLPRPICILASSVPRPIEVSAKGELLGPPPGLADNDATWLDFTDLVFVDPVGTGYSRAARRQERERLLWCRAGHPSAR